MNLRKELEPDFDAAEKLYPKALRIIKQFRKSFLKTEEEDEEKIELIYKAAEAKLHKLTGKDMSAYTLYCVFDGDEETLAFDVSLPAPNIVPDITKEELAELVRRIIEHDWIEDSKTFKETFLLRKTSYESHCGNLLKINFESFDYFKLFLPFQKEDGSYYEYSQEEIAEKLWMDKNKSDYKQQI